MRGSTPPRPTACSIQIDSPSIRDGWRNRPGKQALALLHEHAAASARKSAPAEPTPVQKKRTASTAPRPQDHSAPCQRPHPRHNPAAVLYAARPAAPPRNRWPAGAGGAAGDLVPRRLQPVQRRLCRRRSVLRHQRLPDRVDHRE